MRTIYRSNLKYGNRKITVCGETFDSQKEYKRYRELLLLEKAGEISDLRRQVDYVLIPAQYEDVPRYGKNGKRLKDGKRCIENSCIYKADFVYKVNRERREPLPDGNFNCYEYYETVVEDTKGFKTAEYIIKRKLMLFVHGIKIKEV